MKFSYFPTSPCQPSFVLAFSRPLPFPKRLNTSRQHIPQDRLPPYLIRLYSPKTRCNGRPRIDALPRLPEPHSACSYYSCQIKPPLSRRLPRQHITNPSLRSGPVPHNPAPHPPLHHYPLSMRPEAHIPRMPRPITTPRPRAKTQRQGSGPRLLFLLQNVRCSGLGSVV
jgi:hypothetical protein